MKIQMTILVALSGAALFAQTPDTKGNMAFQQIQVIGAPGAGAKEFFFKTIGPDGPGGATVTGKPLSATETHHSLQVLGDGTRIENTDTDTFYRDDQGRTRVEHGPSGANTVVIHDPVAGYTVILDPAQKTAHKLGSGAKFVSGSGALPPLPPPPPDAALHAGMGTHMAMVTADGVTTMAGAGPITIRRSEIHTSDPVTEDLGTDTINGVLARGTRSTVTIPAGQIGNDRPIQIVNERWESSDLQMLVKSSNNDPRFGQTTYELSNINRAAPPATLFQIPPDYTVDEGQSKSQ